MNDNYNNQNEQQDQQAQQNQQKQQYGYQYGTRGYYPYGQNPYGQQPYTPYGQNYGQSPYGFPPVYQPVDPVHDSYGRNCHTMGLLSIVCIFTMLILSVIFGALALNYAKKSRLLLGYETPEVKSGRIMGMVGLIAGCAIIGIVVLFYLIVFITLLLA